MTSSGTDISSTSMADPASAFWTGPARSVPSGTVRAAGRIDEKLFRAGYEFDFFQAVRLLQHACPDGRAVGRQGTGGVEAARFRVPASLNFPASAIDHIDPPTSRDIQPQVWINFLGLTGPSGILPRHYTELLIRRHIDFRGAERFVLRDWLDLFNHRLISLFYRAWEKYRFWLAYERGEHLRREPDSFTTCLRSLIGLAPPSLHNRLKLNARGSRADRALSAGPVIAEVKDVSLFRFAGLLSQRPRCSANLASLLSDYFLVPVHVQQFQGQWLQIDSDDQCRLEGTAPESQLGLSAIVGPRVWNVQGKFRIRLGPLSYDQFCEFFPDTTPQPARKALFLLSHLVRLFAGPEFDFDVQLTLKREEVVPTRLVEDDGIGARLGWNTWLSSTMPDRDAEDAVIAGRDVPRNFA